MDFGILGPLEVRKGDRVLRLGRGKQSALLALLLLHRDEVVSTDRLIDELWGETPPPSAAKIVQNYVSQLRRALSNDGSANGVLLTRGHGYLLRVRVGELDLDQFERLVDDGGRALDAGAPEEAAVKLREALGLWRGAPLADVAYEPFAQAAVRRLDELRLAALERRIDADLALGRHAEIVAELKALVDEHPLRERLRGQLMLALYRSGRQAEALEAYREARRVLVDELGIEPSLELQRLENAILRQEAPLEREPRAPPARREAAAGTASSERSILVVPQSDDALSALLALAEPLAASDPPGELLLVRLIPPSLAPGESAEFARATAALREHGDAPLSRGVAVRVAAFTSTEPAEDVVRLATEQDVDLLLLDAPLAGDPRRGTLGTALTSASCDVAFLIGADGRSVSLGSQRPVLVPFGAAEHDWAALELGVWLARSHGAPLRLVGAQADLGKGIRDASRLLADASILVQRLSGVVPEPLLVPPGPEGMAEAAGGAGLLVVGLSERWRQEGLGETRLAMARARPTVFVRRGIRPGGLAPRETLTRFSWSLARAGRSG